MGKTDWGPIIVGGVILVGGAYAWINWKTVCPQLFGADSTACSGATPLAAVEGVFTNAQRYMSDKAPATSRINTNPNAQKNAAAAIKAQQDFGNPNSKVAKETKHIVQNAGARKTGTQSPCTGPNAHLYPFCSYYTANSFATITLNRVSIR